MSRSRRSITAAAVLTISGLIAAPASISRAEPGSPTSPSSTATSEPAELTPSPEGTSPLTEEPSLLPGEADVYNNESTEDFVAFADMVSPDPAEEQDPNAPEGEDITAPKDSLPFKLTTQETQLCTRRQRQCGEYVVASRQALAFERHNVALSRKGKSKEDIDDRSQAIRHQFWFASMNATWGQKPAWEWAIAHEGDHYMKTRDSQCDMRNNAHGNVIGVKAGQQLASGTKASVVKAWMKRAVIYNVSHGVYCHR